jgi:23S rRNA pseudouridine1911/1915/1917 synthase
MTQQINLQAEVPDSLAGQRLDQVAAELFPDYSRSRLQTWIKNGDLKVNGEVRKTRDKILGGEKLELQTELVADESWEPQAIALDIIYEDEHLLVINKPVGLVVHPGAGNADSTLLNALLHHCPELATLPRAGIVHRIDKDTTGLLVVAKTLKAHTSLVDQLQEKSAFREYEAIVCGVMTGGGKVDEPIGRHPTVRTKQAVSHSGKPAVTHYRVLERFRGHTHIRVQLETGRTHQIRVHMAHIRYPLLGDPLYGERLRLPKGATAELIEALRGFKRQALHARKLGVIHPATGEYMEWETPLPADFQTMLRILRDDLQQGE